LGSTSTTHPAAAVPKLGRAELVISKEEYKYLAGAVGTLAEGLQELVSSKNVMLAEKLKTIGQLQGQVSRNNTQLSGLAGLLLTSLISR
jgi:hypothetical protein